MKTKAAIALVFGLAAIQSAQAQQTYNHTGYGMATTSCGTWTQARKGLETVNQQNAMVSWAAGYLTATGRFNANMRNTDADGILSYLDNYCGHYAKKAFRGARAR